MKGVCDVYSSIHSLKCLQSDVITVRKRANIKSPQIEINATALYLVISLNKLFSISLFSFHDGNLTLYRPDTTGYYVGSAITGINSPKVTKPYACMSVVSFHKHFCCFHTHQLQYLVTDTSYHSKL